MFQPVQGDLDEETALYFKTIGNILNNISDKSSLKKKERLQQLFLSIFKAAKDIYERNLDSQKLGEKLNIEQVFLDDPKKWFIKKLNQLEHENYVKKRNTDNSTEKKVNELLEKLDNFFALFKSFLEKWEQLVPDNIKNGNDTEDNNEINSQSIIINTCCFLDTLKCILQNPLIIEATKSVLEGTNPPGMRNYVITVSENKYNKTLQNSSIQETKPICKEEVTVKIIDICDMFGLPKYISEFMKNIIPNIARNLPQVVKNDSNRNNVSEDSIQSFFNGLTKFTQNLYPVFKKELTDFFNKVMETVAAKQTSQEENTIDYNNTTTNNTSNFENKKENENNGQNNENNVQLAMRSKEIHHSYNASEEKQNETLSQKVHSKKINTEEKTNKDTKNEKNDNRQTAVQEIELLNIKNLFAKYTVKHCNKDP